MNNKMAKFNIMPEQLNCGVQVFFLDFQGTVTNPNVLIFKNTVSYSEDKGPFNNYVDKMRGEGFRNVCFCPRSGYKNCLRRGGSRNGKILST